MEILAIETKYSPYFNKLICETDILARVQPLMQKVDAMAKQGGTRAQEPEAQAELAALWRGILQGLPAAYQPPFSAMEFHLAIREGQMEKRRLAKMVAADVGVSCPQQLQGLHSDAAARGARLQAILAALFAHLEYQARSEEGIESRQLLSRAALARFSHLPDLLGMAQVRAPEDVYAEQLRLAHALDAEKKPYRLSMPFRNPPRPCRSGAHTTASVKYTLVDPARNAKVELWEAELHEAQVHGAMLPARIVEFLEDLADAD